MNEEIEYAEMLEIPVSTVNVVKKKSRRAHVKNPVALKDKLISRVNSRVDGATNVANAAGDNAFFAGQNADGAANSNAADFAAQSEMQEGTGNEYAFSEGATTLLASDSPRGKKKRFSDKFDANGFADNRFAQSGNANAAMGNSADFAQSNEGETADSATGFAADLAANYANANGNFYENEGGRALTKTKAERRSGIFLTAEFALACALCGAIFLTNVFMPESGINTFFRSLMPAESSKEDQRAYSDFTLSGVVSEFSDAQLTLSPAGVLSFTDECCVYPVANGKIAEVTKNAAGTYDVKISHTNSFYGLIGGLDYVYYAVGDSVYSNVPVGFSKGKSAVQVTMYSDGELLSCYQVDSENCLSWVKETAEQDQK